LQNLPCRGTNRWRSRFAGPPLQEPLPPQTFSPPLLMIESQNTKTTGGIIMTEPTKEELLARIAELEKKAAGGKRSGALEFRVGEKGGVSVYGLGRFPVTLYYEQWVRLLDASKDLRAFLEENKHRLKLKPTE